MADDEMVEWLSGVLDQAEAVAVAASVSDETKWVSVRDALGISALGPEPAESPKAGVRKAVRRTRTVVLDDGLASEEVGDHIALHDPRGVLARVEAERTLLAHLVEIEDGAMGRSEWGDPQVREEAEQALRLLAYGHRFDAPGYRDEWSPDV